MIAHPCMTYESYDFLYSSRFLVDLTTSTLWQTSMLTLSFLHTFRLPAASCLFMGLILGFGMIILRNTPLLRLFNLRSYYISSFLYCRASSFIFPSPDARTPNLSSARCIDYCRHSLSFPILIPAFFPILHLRPL